MCGVKTTPQQAPAPTASKAKAAPAPKRQEAKSASSKAVGGLKSLGNAFSPNVIRGGATRGTVLGG